MTVPTIVFETDTASGPLWFGGIGGGALLWNGVGSGTKSIGIGSLMLRGVASSIAQSGGGSLLWNGVGSGTKSIGIGTLVFAGYGFGVGAIGAGSGALQWAGAAGGIGIGQGQLPTLLGYGIDIEIVPVVSAGYGSMPVWVGTGVGITTPGVGSANLQWNGLGASTKSVGLGTLPPVFGFGLGVWPPAVNWISVLQSPGYVYSLSGITSQLLQANALASATQQSAVGVFLLASAIASDSNLSTQTLQTFVSASAQVYASINQAWYGNLNVTAIAAAPIAYQYTALAAAYANAIATGAPMSTANMSVTITTTMLALALANAQNAALLNVNATAATSATQLYSAMTTIIANAIAATVAAPQLVFMLAAHADALAAVSALPTAAQFAALLANADAYVRVSFNDDDFEGWVVNTTPRGEEGIRVFSNYQNFPYTSFATSPTSGLSYATSATGIYLLAGETDSGTEIPAWIRSGLVDFGSRRDKRMESLYVGYTSDDRLVAKMITTNEGQKVETWYTMRETQLAGAAREGRIEIGKGLHSVYWGFELHNNAGADFVLDVVALWPVILDRRIS